jgi:oligoendopeptidase F
MHVVGLPRLLRAACQPEAGGTASASAGAAAPAGSSPSAGDAAGGAGKGGGEGADGGLAAGTPSRQDVDPAYRWRLEDLYAADGDWERDFARLQELLPEADGLRGRLGDAAGASLLRALEARDAMRLLLERLFAYARMRCDEDTRVAGAQARVARIAALASRLEAAWAWFEPEILELPEETLRGWLAARAAAEPGATQAAIAAPAPAEPPPTDPADPQPAAAGLARYRHALETLLRQKPHVRTRSEEELLAQAGEMARAPQTIFEMLNNADLTFPPVHDERGRPLDLTQARFVRLLEDPRRAVREEAFRGLYATYGQHRHTLAATLDASVRRDWFFARARRYGSCIEMALDADAIPVAVYDSLIAAVRAGLPALHRYLRLRRRALGLDRLHMYDLYVPLVADPQPSVTWDEAVSTVAAALAPLGDDYVRGFRAGVGGGWVDALENRGKRPGAYSFGVYGVHPFVLLNYQGTVGDVFTLAHEFGHALHSRLTDAAQPFVYSDYAIFVAEVASTVNEALLARHLIARAEQPRRRAYLVGRQLEGFRTTVFRQTMFAEFERLIHQRVEGGEPLTADALCAEYRRLNRDYLCYDPAEVELDPEIDLEWARIPHFYRPFYVYQYATGFSAAHALAGAVLAEGEPARRRYLRMLERGSSADPLVLLRDAGVDLASPAPVARAIEAFAQGVEELEDLLAPPS